LCSCLIRARKFRGNVVSSSGPWRDGWVKGMPVGDEYAAVGTQCSKFPRGRIVIPFDPKHGGADPREAFAKFCQKVFATHAECAGCRLRGIAVEDDFVRALKRCDQFCWIRRGPETKV
jgi:hypothetical protein